MVILHRASLFRLVIHYLLPILLLPLGSSLAAIYISDDGETIHTKQHQNATNPIVYTRLRHDYEFLQVYRDLQLAKPHEEKELELRFNETYENKTKHIKISYFKNDLVEASDVSHDDLILHALNRTYQSRLFASFMYNYDNPKDRRRASDPKLVSPSKCVQDLDYLLIKYSELKRAQESTRDSKYWSLSPELDAFFDSYAGEEPGLLFGNYHWTGNWRQCHKRFILDIDHKNVSNTKHFRGRYCIASIRSPSWDKKIADSLKYMESYFKYPEQRYDYARYFRINVGLCLPESCDSQIIDTHQDEIRRLAVHKLSEPLRSYNLADLFCLPDETSELRKIKSGGWMLILASILWCSAISLATYVDRRWQREGAKRASKKTSSARSTKSVAEKLVSAMSLYKNYERLTETDSIRPPPRMKPSEAAQNSGSLRLLDGSDRSKQVSNCDHKPSPNDLLFLNSVKVVALPLIIWGHTAMLGEQWDRFPLDFESHDSDFLFHLAGSSVFYVDWYFVMTGFITTYIMMVTRKAERNTPIQWAYSIFHRYWRLAPIYIILFWFCRHLFKFTGQGPVWDYGVSNMSIRSVCQQESWLWPITLTSNWHSFNDECIMPSWYISSDMQFYLLTPFLLILLTRSPLTGWLTILSIIGGSISTRAHRYLTDSRIQLVELLRPRFDLFARNSWDATPTYLYPHFRISSYLVGMLAGHYAYMVLTGRWNSILYLGPESSQTNLDTSKQQTHMKQKRQRSLNKSANKPESGSKTSPHRDQSTGSNTDQNRLKRFSRTLTWFMGLQMVVSMMFSSGIVPLFFPRSMEVHIKYIIPIIYGFSHTVAASGMALMFVTFMFGQFPRLKRLLEHPVWTLISRLNFTVFIAQVEIIYWLHQSSERVIDFSSRDAFKQWFLLTCVCYMLSVFVTLLLELPLANLEREFIGNLINKTNHSSSSSSSSSNNNTSKASGVRPKHLQEHCELGAVRATCDPDSAHCPLRAASPEDKSTVEVRIE